MRAISLVRWWRMVHRFNVQDAMFHFILAMLEAKKL